jgi:hypothetical protein
MLDESQLSLARNAIVSTERTYSQDWSQDATEWERRGLYLQIARLVNPSDGRFVADIGTGLGHQLIYLGGVNPRGLYIGTERTPLNVAFAQQYLRGLGLEAVSAAMVTELKSSPDRRLYWGQRSLPGLLEMRAQILEVLKHHLFLIDDDIRRPQSLPAILGDEKLDAAILSMPGGSAIRAHEWPFAPGDLTDDESRTRITAATNETRSSFYHFASQAVRDGGKAVLAERVSAPEGANILNEGAGMLRRFIGNYAKYWHFGRIAVANHPGSPDTVPLIAEGMTSHQLQGMGRTTHAFIAELIRNTVDFTEPPRPGVPD